MGPLSEEESLLLAAWDAERREAPWDAEEIWEGYARYLIHEHSGNDPQGKPSLRIALALRRCGRVAGTPKEAASFAGVQELDDSLVSQLEESLTWDPDDRATYLRLIDHYRREKRPKDARRFLERALERWPQDMQVLDAAFGIAITAGSFKKAAGFARRMLTLDRINSEVRERLVEAHLAHARKQIIKGRSDLAHKELAEAREWARSTQATTQVDLVAGLLTLREDAAAGAPVLRDLVARLGGGLAGHLTLALAGEALALSPQVLFKRIGLAKPTVDGRDDLLATLAKLRVYDDGGGELTDALGGYLSLALGGGPWRDLSRSETEAACETLRRSGLYRVRRQLAEIALKRWPNEPLFELHAFEAKYPRQHYDLASDADLEHLQEAGERAREDGDTRTAMRIEQAIVAHAPLPFTYLSDDEPDESDEPDDPPLQRDLVIMMIRTVGLKETMEAMGLPPEMRSILKKLARREGTEAAAEKLLSFLEMIVDLADRKDKDPPTPRPPIRKPAKAAKRPAPRRSDAGEGQDKKRPRQPDMLG